MNYKIIIFVLTALKCAETANILGVFSAPGTSHYILGSKLMKGLAEAGHNVTMISPYELKDKPKNGKYTDVILTGMGEDYTAFLESFNLFGSEETSFLEKLTFLTKIFSGYTNTTLNHPNVKNLLKTNQKFDAVIIEQFANDALKVFSYIYGCPLILLSSLGPSVWVNPTVGNPQPPSLIPHIWVRDFSPDSFLDRAKNLIFFVSDYFVTQWLYTLPHYNKMIHQAVPDAPDIFDLFTNVSLVLLNSHTSYYKAVPVVPNMVEIGGYFIDPPKRLPKDLQEFLDGASNGVVYFSMGSNLKSKDFPEEKKKALLNALGKLKQKVLWKFEEDLPNKPANVIIRKWLPQQDILAHPNVILFITHGGLLSTTEAIYHGVPVLAIPVFGDQPANADRAVAGGYGLKLEYNDKQFSEEKLSALLDELLQNSKYGDNAKARSKVYHDRPQKPMDTAVYWVEYVIRHKGAEHLRVAGVRMPWYKYFMVDVIGTLLVSVVVLLYLLRLAVNIVFCKKSDENRKKIKKH